MGDREGTSREQRATKWPLLLMIIALFLRGTAITARATQDSWQLISPELLEHAKLRMVWQGKLPVQDAETPRQLTIVGDRIYILSDHNYMFCLDSEKGSVVFSKPIAPAGFAVLGLDPYGNELVSVIGNKLVGIDKASGAEHKVANLQFGIVCPAGRNSQYFYLSGVDRRLHAVRADDKVEAFQVAAENESLITSVVAEEGLVVFATDAGNLIGIAPDRPKKLWQFDAVESIVAPIIKDGMSFYFACKDTNVYRVDMADTTGVRLVWKYQTEAVLDRAPHITGSVIYQYALGGGLTAIDKQTGRALWSLPEGLDLLAEARGKAYLITKHRTLAVMDNSTAKKLYWVNFAAVSRHATNITDSKIYVADEFGRIACLEPVQ